MAEYIDREALLKRLCNDDPANMEDYYYNAIKNAPTADVVEVVRCKDCAWYDEWNRCVNSHCTKSYYGCHVKENHFCSYGERKDGAE